MGVKGLYASLRDKYPEMLHSVNKGEKTRIECDNLYLDMNEIVHRSAHSCARVQRNQMERVMMIKMMDKIDQIISVVQPKKLLYVVLDGVAPRAKRNQQRLRRFTRSQAKGDEFSGNCLSPGSVFMCKLSQNLLYYLHLKINNNPKWKHLSIIFSDANVPGEGEHKIIEFIRRQRSQSFYDTNTKHVICGSDADLILLGLATHENYFTILREDSSSVKWIFISIRVLRQCLNREFNNANFPFVYDLERVVDDWIFLCLLLGNDFLPDLPMLRNIASSLTKLVSICKRAYKENLEWLTHDGIPNLIQVKYVLTELIGKSNAEYKLGARKRRRLEGENHSPIVPSVEPEAGPSSRQDDDLKRKISAPSKVGTRDGLQPDSSRVTLEYVRGLFWILQYYYQGVPSWDWFYPFHHSPVNFAFGDISENALVFETGTRPLLPLEQLMSLLPPWNSSLVPQPWRSLMTDPESTLAEFYPQRLEGTVLPFLDEEKLNSALKDVYHKLTDEERKRNEVSNDLLIVGQHHNGYAYLRGLPPGDQLHILNTALFSFISGSVFSSEKCVRAGETLVSPVNGLGNINNCNVLCMNFRNPSCETDRSEAAVIEQGGDLDVTEAEKNFKNE